MAEVSEVRDYRRSLQRSNEARTRKDRPNVFSMNGREWDLLHEVFAPIYSPSTSIALDFLGYSEAMEFPRRGSMLEVGCGAGVIAVTGALSGCARVVASDINSAAVQNTKMNAVRHGVYEQVEVVQSDLFDQLRQDERFDLIFWSSNYVLAPPEYQYKSVHERAYVDPGYAVHRRFLIEAPGKLTQGGSALLHFSSRGDVDGLNKIAREVGRTLRTIDQRLVTEGPVQVKHMLLEVVPA